MSDSLYVKVGSTMEALDLGTGSSAPEYVERIEALESGLETVSAEALGVKADTVLAAQNAADASGGSLGDADLNQILSAYESVSGELATLSSELVTAITGLTEKPGFIKAFAANSTPEGYLLCNGATVSRTTYAGLFAVIGTTHGSGNGSTTFNLPNLTDRFIQGSGTAGTVKSANLPSSKIGGVYGNVDFGTTGAFQTNTKFMAIQGNLSAGSGMTIYGYEIQLGTGTTVQPPALTMRFYIKY